MTTINRVLVTGSTGFLGTRLIEQLIADGYSVKAFARLHSNVKKLRELKADIVYGDVSEEKSLYPAFRDIDFVIHTAADTTGNLKETQLTTIQGTKNIIELSIKFKIKKLIYISSCSVYETVSLKRNEIIDENYPIEPMPEKRGTYSFGKVEAEKLVLKAMKEKNIPVISVRPGIIWGPGGKIYTPMLGLSLKNRIFIVFGNGGLNLPLIFIDNLVDSIVKILRDNKTLHSIFNILDDTQMSKKEYINKLVKPLLPQAKIVYFPYSLLLPIIFFQEIIFKVVRKEPYLSIYRFKASQKDIRISSDKVRKELKWAEKIGKETAIEKTIQYMNKR